MSYSDNRRGHSRRGGDWTGTNVFFRHAVSERERKAEEAREKERDEQFLKDLGLGRRSRSRSRSNHSDRIREYTRQRDTPTTTPKEPGWGTKKVITMKRKTYSQEEWDAWSRATQDPARGYTVPKKQYTDEEWNAWQNSWNAGTAVGNEDSKSSGDPNWGGNASTVEEEDSNQKVKPFAFNCAGLLLSVAEKFEEAVKAGILFPGDIPPHVLKTLAQADDDIQRIAAEKFLATFNLQEIKNKPGWLLASVKKTMVKQAPARVEHLPEKVRAQLVATFEQGGLDIEIIDNKCVQELMALPDDLQLACIGYLSQAQLAHVRSVTGFFIGIVRRVKEEAEKLKEYGVLTQPKTAALPGAETKKD